MEMHILSIKMVIYMKEVSKKEENRGEERINGRMVRIMMVNGKMIK